MKAAHKAPFIFSCLFILLFPAISNAYEYSGFISNRYILRTTGSDSDNDIETLFSIDMGNPFRDLYTASFQFGGLFDIEGTSEGSVFSGPNNALGEYALARVYHAYLDIKEQGPIYRIRIGRQYKYNFENFYFDGVALESDPSNKIAFDIYGGVPVHLFESQSGFDPGDWVAGGSIDWNPVAGFKLHYDYVHLKDRVSGFRASVGDTEDDLFGLSAWWNVDRRLELYSRFTSFSDQVRDVEFSAAVKWAEQDLRLSVRIYTLLKGYSFRVIDLNGYEFAGVYEPYYDILISASKFIGKHFSFEGGAGLRFLKDYQIASAFNHGYSRFFVTLSVYDVLLKDFTISTTQDYYRGTDNSLENNSFGTSFYAAKYFLKRRLSLNLGSSFYFYRYNLYLGSESSNVQTYYVGAETKLIDRFRIKLNYEFEDNDFDNFHTINFSVIWSFK